MPLDFSKLDKLAYRGFDTAEARAQKDAFVERGCMPAEGEKTPFEAPAQPEAVEPAYPKKQPPAGQIQPSTARKKQVVGVDGTNYNRIAGDLFNYLGKYMPPRLTDEYWIEAQEDMNRIMDGYGGNTFVEDIFEALGKEMKKQSALLEEQQRRNT